jgi:ketosteroid isomerase-like protein
MVAFNRAGEEVAWAMMPVGEGVMRTNLETVQQIYAAFGAGDVTAILSVMSDDVEWEYGFADPGVPWLKRRRGKEGVAAFFAALGEGVEFLGFRVGTIAAADDKVLALIDLHGRVRRTGRELREEDEVHIWQFGADGRVVRFRHALDTAQHAAAWAG